MVSHGNEYPATKAGESYDSKKLIDSTEGLSN